MSIFNDQCPYSMIKEEEGSEPEKRGGRETEGWREQEEGEMKGEGIWWRKLEEERGLFNGNKKRACLTGLRLLALLVLGVFQRADRPVLGHGVPEWRLQGADLRQPGGPGRQGTAGGQVSAAEPGRNINQTWTKYATALTQSCMDKYTVLSMLIKTLDEHKSSSLPLSCATTGQDTLKNKMTQHLCRTPLGFSLLNNRYLGSTCN